jgi:signal transduction histidine kinase
MTSEEMTRILVVDDEQPVREAYRAVLCTPVPESDELAQTEAELFGAPESAADKRSFDVTFAAQGEEAVAAIGASVAEDRPYQLAFLDVRMPPGIDGVETARRIRQLDDQVNIVIVTGYSDNHPRDIATQVPPFDKLFYISKPFQALELHQFALALDAKWHAERSLRRTNLDLREKYAELEATHRDLTAAKQEVERANHAKSEFLASMSHELRTPLNAVIGFAELMRSETLGPLGDERYRGYADDIYHGGAHLLLVINDLLDFSKAEANKIELRCEILDPKPLVNGVLRLVREQAHRGRVELRVDDLSVLPVINGDELRLRQILLNLLSNAVKFTPPGGVVTISGRRDSGGNLIISVVDTGIGMTEKDLEQAFEPFGQVDSAFARRFQGTGLGLPIAKRLIELHGGTLRLTSRIGSGTEAAIHLPADRLVTAA